MGASSGCLLKHRCHILDFSGMEGVSQFPIGDLPNNIVNDGLFVEEHFLILTKQFVGDMVEHIPKFPHTPIENEILQH